MKIAKYVVIAQMVLSAVLVVIFVTRSMASNRVRAAKTDDHASVKEAEGGGHGAEKGEKSGKGAKGEAAEHGEHGDHGEDKAEASESRGDSESDESASKKAAHSAGRLALHEGAESGELKLDVVKPEAEPGKADRKGRDKDKGHDKESVRKDDDGDASTFGTDPKLVAQNLLAGNSRFIAGRRSGFDLVEQRETSAKGQHPGVMVLGCADSRVPPELIFDRGVGEMFVVRSAGNIAEPVAVGSLEYAAEHLHTKVLLILGHEKCGAVQAALSDAKLPSVNLEALVDAISPAVKELKAWVSGDQLIHMAVEANVRRQADEVMRRSPLLREAAARKELTVLKAVYDLQSGRVRPL